MRRATERHIGFTLIELLIVVAIIAILAAIAVPNFLEAQTRSKVARAKSDMRATATAIESYYVDWNRPPLPGNYYVGNSNLRFWWPWIVLTTPTSYIASPLIDPFGSTGVKSPTGFILNMEQWKFYQYQSPSPAVTAKSPGSVGVAGAMVWAQGLHWMLRSVGPDRVHMEIKGNTANAEFYQTAVYRAFGHDITAAGQTVPSTPDHIYDATNGTISHGDIWRDTKGQAN